LQPFAGISAFDIAEYPVEPQLLCQELTVNKILPDQNGMIMAPDSPGTGITIDVAAVQKYLIKMQIEVAGEILYTTPNL
jgi:L-alanine-DL-glutamate epimerase-like enolase superfamily enzyme